jgi:hypothetical protein
VKNRLLKILLGFAVVLLLAPISAYAVETVTSSEFFSIELFAGTQSPWSKRVPVTIKFRSNRDAEKTEISWDAPTGVQVIEKHPQFISVTKGEVYTYSALIAPQTSGTYNIAVNVTAWEVNTNYTSSSNITLKFDDALVADEDDPGYKTASLIKTISLGLLGIIVVVIAAFGVKLGFEKLREWLKPPE